MTYLNLSQILIMLLQCLLVSILILSLFRLRFIMGIGVLYITLGVFQYFQVFLASIIYVEIMKGIFVSPGSVVLFSASLFTVLLIYIEEDALEARKVIYALFAANIVVSLFQIIFGWSLNNPGVVNLSNIPSEFFFLNARVMLAGSVTLFFDAVLVMVFFEFFSRYLKHPFLRILVTMSIVLSIDSVFFSIGAFAGTGKTAKILVSGIIAKNIVAVIYSVFFSIYLIMFNKKKGDIFNKSLNDIFQIMTYRQKFEKALKEKEKIKNDALKKIREGEKRYKKLLDISPVGISVLTENKIVFVNPAGVRLIGANTPEDIIGKDLSEIVHPDNLAKSKEKLKKLIAGEKGIFPVENVLRRLDGTIIYVELMAEFLIYRGKPSAQVVVSDITKRKQIEKELDELNKDLEKKVEEKTEELRLRINELERFYDATIEREFKIKELNNRIHELMTKYGENPD